MFLPGDPIVVRGKDIYGHRSTGPHKFHRYFFHDPTQEEAWVLDGGGEERPFRLRQIRRAEEDKSSFIPEVWD